MRSTDFPAIASENPGLRLAPDTGNAVARKFDTSGGAVPSIGVEQDARQTCRRARCAKCANLGIADQVFGGAIAHRVKTVPEQVIERSDFVVGQGLFIARKGSLYFGHDVGQLYALRAGRRIAQIVHDWEIKQAAVGAGNPHQ